MRFLPAGPDRQRRWVLQRAPAGPFRDYLAVPFPDPATPVAELPLLAVDIETTGFDHNTDQILSIGFVPVHGPAIELGGAQRITIRADVEVGQSAAIHGITDDALADGIPVADALPRLLAALTGRVLLAHYATLELKFLSAVCRRLYGHRLPCVRVDTMLLQHRILTRDAPHTRQDDPLSGALRLWNARERFGLPAYRAHEALTDALACAELYLAQVALLELTGRLHLRNLS